MGGERIIEIEQNLLKAWVLGNWDVLGTQFKRNKKDILSKIKQYFESKKKSFLKTDYTDLTEIEERLRSIKVNDKNDVMSFVEEADIEVEENGGGHGVTINEHHYVYPDPEFSIRI